MCPEKTFQCLTSSSYMFLFYSKEQGKSRMETAQSHLQISKCGGVASQCLYLPLRGQELQHKENGSALYCNGKACLDFPNHFHFSIEISVLFQTKRTIDTKSIFLDKPALKSFGSNYLGESLCVRRSRELLFILARTLASCHLSLSLPLSPFSAFTEDTSRNVFSQKIILTFQFQNFIFLSFFNPLLLEKQIEKRQ